jgi:spermidine/putrescine transport system permease protein
MRGLRAVFLAPSALVLAALVAAPLGVILAYSFATRGVYGGVEWPLTLENWRRLLDPLYGAVFFRTVILASAATALCLLLGFPLALFISRAGPRKNLYLYLVMLPFWTSFLVRMYSWLFLLRETGVINAALLGLGLIREPLAMLYTPAAVLVGLVYAHLPFMVLPLYATLERMDRSLIEAAADLGAKPWQTLWRVVIPMAAPGIRAGTTLVFIPCLGAYLTPDLLGGSKVVMVGNVIQNQFTLARDWPFGSATALALMAVILVLLFVLIRREKEPLL